MVIKGIGTEQSRHKNQLFFNVSNQLVKTKFK